MVKRQIKESVNTMTDKIYDNVALLGYACTLACNDLHHIHLNAVGDKFQEIHSESEQYMDRVAELNDFCLELAKEGGLSLYNETVALDVIKDSGNNWVIEEADSYNFEQAFKAISNVLSDLSQFIVIIQEMEGVTTDVSSELDTYLREFTKAVNYFIPRKLSNEGIIYSDMDNALNDEGVTESMMESYAECYRDVSGMFGEPDDIVSIWDMKTYWNTYKNSDPVLMDYDTYEDWLSDTISSMEPIYESRKVRKNKLFIKDSKKLMEDDDFVDVMELISDIDSKDMDHWGSDLYLRKTPKTTKIVDSLPNSQRKNVTTFRDQIDHDIWYEIPFAWHK